MSSEMACAKIGCDKPVTYDRLLCYTHWQQYDRYEIFECERCHRLDEVLVGPEDELCFDCMRLGEVPVHVHAQLTYQEHYLYILKLDGGDFYVGRTNDLERSPTGTSGREDQVHKKPAPKVGMVREILWCPGIGGRG